MGDTMLGPAVAAQGSALLFALALVVLVVSLFQAVSLFLRQSAVPLLGLMLPVAAAGQLGPAGTRAWLPLVVNTVVAIVLYKPLVALLLAAGFAEIDTGSSVLDAVRGMVCLVLSAFALKWMLKVFAPYSTRIAAGGGHSGALLAASGGLAGATAMRGMTAGTSSAPEAAAWMNNHGPANGHDPDPSGGNPSGTPGEHPGPLAPGSEAPSDTSSGAGPVPVGGLPAPRIAPGTEPATSAAGRGGATAGAAAVGLAAAGVVVQAVHAAGATVADGHEGDGK
jgi:hypothetical protein